MDLLFIVMFIETAITTIEEFGLALDCELGVPIMPYFYSEYFAVKFRVKVTQMQHLEYIMKFLVKVEPRPEMS